MNNLYSKDKLSHTTHISLLLSTLLEFFCQHNSDNIESFKALNNYIHNNGLVEQDFSSNEHSHERKLYFNILKTLLHNFENIKNKKLVINNDLNINSNSLQIISDNNLLDTKIEKDVNILKSRYYDDFLQISKIGNGGFGIVYKVYNKFDKNYYAIKKIPITFSFNKIHREIEYLSKLDHPNVVRYFSSWIEYDPFIEKIDDDIDEFSIEYLSESNSNNDLVSLTDKEDNTNYLTIYIQMQLCNYNLKDWLTVRNKNISVNTRYNLELNIELAIKIFKQILNGVEYIHSKGIIHRDLKTTNIFLDKDLNIKIGDFGLAIKNKTLKTEKLVSSSCGTQLYAAPEQYNLSNIDEKVDVYSLGIILFELCYPLTTEMERIIVLNDFKKQKFPKDFVNNDKLKCLLLSMIDTNTNKRISLNQVIQNINKYYKINL